MADEIKDTINEIAKDGVRRAQGDQGSVETHSIPDLIAADNHVNGKTATKKPVRQLKFFRQSPPGATGT